MLALRAMLVLIALLVWIAVIALLALLILLALLALLKLLKQSNCSNFCHVSCNAMDLIYATFEVMATNERSDRRTNGCKTQR